jgi:hypothetical protein
LPVLSAAGASSSPKEANAAPTQVGDADMDGAFYRALRAILELKKHDARKNQLAGIVALSHFT